MAVRQYGKNQVIAKQENITLLKALLYRRGPTSRAEIAEQLDLTPLTITNITAELIHDGILQEIHSDSSDTVRKVGRQPIAIDFVADARFALGISLGRDKTHYCILDLKGNPVYQEETDVMPQEYDQMTAVLKQKIHEILDNRPEIREKLIGIGAAVPAVIDAHKGIICQIDAERASWQNKPLAEDIAEEFNLPVRVENNVRARTMTLTLFCPDVIREYETFILCYASWGIAGPMIVQERSVRGEYGAAGEIGHMVMDAESGKTLEEFASLRSVLAACRETMKRGGAPVLRNICKDPADPTIEEIHAAQEAGDGDVQKIMENAMYYIGIALSNMISFMNPDLIVLAGPMFAREENRKRAESVMRAHAYSADIDHTAVKYMEFDAYAGAEAAAASCIDKFFVRRAI